MSDPALDRSGGFTLLETLVALGMFAAAIVVLQQATAAGLRGVRAVERDVAALELARGKLAEIGNTGPITGESDVEGNAGSLHWRVAIRRYRPPEPALMPSQVAAYRVAVSVGWHGAAGHAHHVELETIRLQAVP